MPFSYLKRVAYYETDAMAVVHHSNHLRYFEEARVAWMRARNLDRATWQDEQVYFPLVESSVRYIKPARFDDELDVRLQVRKDSMRFHFQYAIYKIKTGSIEEKEPVLLATGATMHVLVDKNFRVTKNLPPQFDEVLEKESWTETWP